jgi:hypothetical protein
MRTAFIVGLMLVSANLFAKERITTVGKAEITCPANLTCTLSFYEANELYRTASLDALNKFAAICTKQDHKNGVKQNTETKVECVQSNVKVTCTAVMQNDCELEYVEPFYM